MSKLERDLGEIEKSHALQRKELDYLGPHYRQATEANMAKRHNQEIIALEEKFKSALPSPGYGKVGNDINPAYPNPPEYTPRGDHNN
jgi:hypothetical protein